MSEAGFVKTILSHYKRAGRDFPWRKTTNPYRILVSEIMLQQTQADRAVAKYKEFLKAFPTVQALAGASLKEVLIVWQGLGYNRRAKMLHATAQKIADEYRGKVPKKSEELETLPGLGPYTARAICAFAYNQPVVFIETNIRSVYIHFFFKDKEHISDKELLPYLERTLYRKNPRTWYSALMDYGAFLKKQEVNPSRKSKHYVKQSRFKGSDRELRGAILKLLLKNAFTESSLVSDLPLFTKKRIQTQLKTLTREGFVTHTRGHYRIA
jgi:A/G-specific adenine glycosylase